jgi:DnaJ family protein C protein 1
VLSDLWTQDQQLRFESALLTFTSDLVKRERWVKVAAAVGGKSVNQCLARYKYIKHFVKEKIHIELSNL